MASITSKCCSTCGELKSFDEFNKSKNCPFGLHYVCKECRKLERIKNKEKTKITQKKYYEENKKDLLEKSKKYREENVESISIQRKGYRELNKEHIQQKNKEYLPIRKEQIKLRRKTDKDFRLKEIVRSKYHRMIKGMNTSYIEKIGCDNETLIKWLEFQFDENMNWDNLGDYWQIDHILPLNKFKFSENNNDVRVCFNWTNLQPLYKNENRSKSDKIELHYYCNSIINIHRFIQNNNSNFDGYQRINESLFWLREKLRYGKNPIDKNG
jgi:hypothetical protein